MEQMTFLPPRLSLMTRTFLSTAILTDFFFFFFGSSLSFDSSYASADGYSLVWRSGWFFESHALHSS